MVKTVDLRTQRAGFEFADEMLDFPGGCPLDMDWYDILLLAAFLVIWFFLVTRVLPKYGGG